jgi:hypothetical protein
MQSEGKMEELFLQLLGILEAEEYQITQVLYALNPRKAALMRVIQEIRSFLAEPEVSSEDIAKFTQQGIEQLLSAMLEVDPSFTLELPASVVRIREESRTDRNGEQVYTAYEIAVSILRIGFTFSSSEIPRGIEDILPWIIPNNWEDALIQAGGGVRTLAEDLEYGDSVLLQSLQQLTSEAHQVSLHPELAEAAPPVIRDIIGFWKAHDWSVVSRTLVRWGAMQQA